MRRSLNSKIERLRTDYARITGKPFVYFFCPVLFKDEQAEPCKAHIVPKAFPRSSRAWTVQRKDVDSFYGANFEDDFVAIRYRIEGQSPGQVLTDKRLSRRLRPSILVDGEPVDHFVAHEAVPECFTPVEFRSEGKCVKLGLKIPPDNAAAVLGGKLEIEIAIDARIPALVSLIKAAHLALFDMLGYRYPLSAGGHFVGRQILGEFFCRNHGKSKSDVGQDALVFFREFARMVRAVQRSDLDLQGTVSDGELLVCTGRDGLVWGVVVFIRTSRQLHAVLIPVFDESDAVPTFLAFLQDQQDSIHVRHCTLSQRRWQIRGDVRKLVWPKTGTLYP